MAKLVEEHNQENTELVGGTLSKTEQFLDDNKKMVTFVVVGILVAVAAYYAYKKIYVASLEKEATAKMFVAERHFERDSFNLALKGVAPNVGFLDIIDQYGATRSANLAHYYAGVSYLHLGEYDKAIEHLKDFDGDDTQAAAIALGCIGDAYLEKDDMENAISYYNKAVDTEDGFAAPRYLKKMGLIYEKKGDVQKAIEMFEKIKKEYFESQEAIKADKYIARLKAKM